MMNVLNGGAHADNNLDIQEFMIIPAGAPTFAEALRMGAETFHHLKKVLKARGLNTAVGDEGGFAPNLQSNEEAMEVLMEAIQAAGYQPGKDVFIGIDAAASEFYENGTYRLRAEARPRKSLEELIDYYEQWVSRYPILSLEDGMAEEDWDGWRQLTQRLGNRIQLVGDDVFVTNTSILARGIREGVANSHPDQVESNRHGDRNFAGHPHGLSRRVHGGDIPPVRGNGGYDHRGPGGRNGNRPDQDGIFVQERADGQVQSTFAHRRGTGRCRSVRWAHRLPPGK